MGADLQYNVKFNVIGPIFQTIEWESGHTVRFIRENGDTKFTLKVNLFNVLDGLLSKSDFEVIEYSRDQIERAERHDDIERVKEVKAELKEVYDTDSINDYDEFNGDYQNYILAVAEKVLASMDEYKDVLEDEDVFVETWL